MRYRRHVRPPPRLRSVTPPLPYTGRARLSRVKNPLFPCAIALILPRLVRLQQCESHHDQSAGAGPRNESPAGPPASRGPQTLFRTVGHVRPRLHQAPGHGRIDRTVVADADPPYATRPARLEEYQAVLVEYGPGVGTFCRPVLERMAGDATLIAIDTNERFHRLSAQGYSRQPLHRGSRLGGRCRGNRPRAWLRQGRIMSSRACHSRRCRPGSDRRSPQRRTVCCAPVALFSLYQFRARARDFLAAHFHRSTMRSNGSTSRRASSSGAGRTRFRGRGRQSLKLSFRDTV